MIILEMKKQNVVLTEKQQKYHLYHQVKLINKNILQVKKFYCQIKEWYIFSFRKALEKQEKAIEEEGKKQVQALEFLKPNTQKLTIEDVVPENTVKKLKMNLIKSKKYKNW